MSKCIFCNIINHTEPAAKIFEDELVLIFLDRRPLFHGHCLLVPKQHYETLNDLPSNLVAFFFTKLQEINAVVQEGMKAKGTFIAMNNKVSQSVPHLHVHIVPRSPGDGLKGFFWPRTGYKHDEMNTTLATLQDTWRKLYG